MKYLAFALFILFSFTSCKDEVTKEDCLKENKLYKIEKVLNYRTGEKELKVICIEK